MGNYKKADHRLVQPQAKHYKQRVDDAGKTVDVLCGPYSLEQRDQFFAIKISLYLTRHPDGDHKKAKQSAFMAWRNLVFSTIGDEYVPAKASKDAIKVFKGVKNDAK